MAHGLEAPGSAPLAETSREDLGVTSPRPVVWLMPGDAGDGRDLADRASHRAVAQVLGVPPADVAVGREHSGRPVPLGLHAGAAAISITHTDGLVAVAAAAGPLLLGIDAERVRTVRSAAVIAGRRFHPAEARVLAGLPEPELSHEFLRMWSLKEAYGKAVGHGVAMSLSACRTDRGALAAPPPPGGGHWYSAVRSLGAGTPGHVVALVVAAPGASTAELRAEIRYGMPGSDTPPRGIFVLSPEPGAPRHDDGARPVGSSPG
jgi:4'-phosphopantetheinyl transferase